MAEVAERPDTWSADQKPAGTVNVFDPDPLNWLFITWNTMEEPVRTDEQGRLTNAAMDGSEWVDDTTLRVGVRKDVTFQNGEALSAEHFKRAFDEVQRWKAPHPPGTYLNFHKDAECVIVDDHTVEFRFPERDGLVLAKFRGLHIPSMEFWRDEGFGEAARGTAEGHW